MNEEIIKNFFIWAESPIDSLEHETYLNIYLTIKRLFMNSIFTKDDIKILENYLYGYSQREISGLLNMDRRYISKRLQFMMDTLTAEIK